jgi:hypothetical protein
VKPDEVRDAVEQHPSVKVVTLVGSRARGDATPLSDWDFSVETDDFPALRDALPALVAPLAPLTTLWDRLADHATFMLILRGPTKVDLLFDDQPNATLPPYEVNASTLPTIDSHFWDWSLWLVSKQAKGKTDLVASELSKMTWYILSPMGIERTPGDLNEAVDLYLVARSEHEQRFGVHVDPELGSQVARVVHTYAEAS